MHTEYNFVNIRTKGRVRVVCEKKENFYNNSSILVSTPKCKKENGNIQSVRERERKRVTLLNNNKKKKQNKCNTSDHVYSYRRVHEYMAACV